MSSTESTVPVPPAIPVRPKKRLAVFCDGTWNQLSAKEPTNVVLGAQMVLPYADTDGTQQLFHYVQGVGTVGGMRDNVVVGGALALELEARVELQLDRLDAYVRDRLRKARANRVPPARDDKVVTGWNGLAIAGLAEAGALLDRPDLVERAREAARLVVERHYADGRLVREAAREEAGCGLGRRIATEHSR